MTKVYFPRLIFPLRAVLSGLTDFGLAFLMVFVLMAYYRVPLSINIIYLPALLLLAAVSSLGVSLWLSALNVRVRDIAYGTGYMVRIWLYLTPVVYSSSVLPPPWNTLYALNPMAGVVEGFRWALLGVDTAPGPIILVSTLIAVLLLISGAYYFRRVEKIFADMV